jgi:hypothetical protein
VEHQVVGGEAMREWETVPLCNKGFCTRSSKFNAV